MYTSNETKQRWDFEIQQSSYLDGIDAKLRAVEQTLNRTVVSFATNFTTLNGTLNKVEADTTWMSELLEASRTQLHHLRNNKAAQVTAMQEHCNRMDNMDAMLIRITKSITKTMNLAQETDPRSWPPALPLRPTTNVLLIAYSHPGLCPLPDLRQTTCHAHPWLTQFPTIPSSHQALQQPTGCAHPRKTQFPTTPLPHQTL